MTAVRFETTLAIKALDRDDGRWLLGTATTPSTDLQGDRVDPQGARYTLPLPLLLGHRHDRIVGSVREAQASTAGIKVHCKLTEGVRDADEAWALARDGALRGLSIGFVSLKSEPLSTGGLHFREWHWSELSLVAVAAQPEAGVERVVGKGFVAPVGRFVAETAADRVAGTVKSYIERQFAPLDERLKKLEAGGRTVRGLDADAFGEEIGTLVRDLFVKERAVLHERLGGLQARVDRGLSYDGTWDPARPYPAGSLVKHNGALFVAVKSVSPGGNAPAPRDGGAWVRLTGA